MKFVSLTQYHSGDRLYINPQAVTAVWSAPDPRNTCLSVDEKATFTVVGTKEEVVAILEGVQV